MGTQWILRLPGRPEIATENFGDVIAWFRDGHVSSKASIFDPRQDRWYSPEWIVPLVVYHLPATTTHTIEDHKIVRYIDIESVEVVIGTGPFSEFTGAFQDFLGERSTAFEQKLQHAKLVAMQKLKFAALRKGGNALVGVDIDYTEFSGNRIGVVASGTIVLVERTGSQGVPASPSA